MRNQKINERNEIRNLWLKLKETNKQIEDRIDVKTRILESLWNNPNPDKEYSDLIRRQVKKLMELYKENSELLSRYEYKLNDLSANTYVGGFEIQSFLKKI